MIKFYYSNKEEFVDSTGEESLGGYISCNTIKNNGKNNIFNSITFGNEETNDIRGLFLRNDGEETLKNVKFFIEVANDFAQYQVAFVTPNEKGMIEILDNPNEEPNDVEFLDVTSSFSQLEIQVLSGSKGNEILNIDGYDIYFNKATPIKKIRNQIYNALSRANLYLLEKQDDDKLLVKYELLEDYDIPITWRTNGTIQLSISPWETAYDNAAIILDEMKPGQTLGMWIKRTAQTEVLSCKELEEMFELTGEAMQPGLSTENFTFYTQYVTDTAS